LHTGRTAPDCGSDTINERRAAIFCVVGNGHETQDPRVKHFCYRLEAVPLSCFFVDVVVDLLLVDFAGLFALDLVVDFAVVRLLAVFAVDADLVPVRGADFAAVVRDAVLGAGSVVAIASMRGAGFFGIAARTWRTALVCCSSVIRNS
jgi:hypothetical protein